MASLEKLPTWQTNPPAAGAVAGRNDSAPLAVPFSKVEGPMNVGDERSRSLWMDIDAAPGTSKLARDIECDTVIVGSGIAGLSTAYELAGQGQKVVVLDRGKIGRGMTARTTAHLTSNNDDGFSA